MQIGIDVRVDDVGQKLEVDLHTAPYTQYKISYSYTVETKEKVDRVAWGELG